MQFHHFLGVRRAQPREPLHRRVVGRHGVPVAVAVQRGRTHMELCGEDAVTAPRAVLQPSEQFRESLGLGGRHSLFPSSFLLVRSRNAFQGNPVPPGQSMRERSSFPHSPLPIAAASGHPAR
ncbi:hypothetical protein CU044_7457 [Streptomyces sp. L-9-10]|nr:hypothetical protein CU044_7457 [Streptomyces sp. L-9-10]